MAGNDYKYSVSHDDEKIRRIQKETEDNFSPQVKKFKTRVPKASEMTDGDMVGYREGSTAKIYLKINGERYSVSLDKE